jgi:hypothetical protein
VATTTRSRPPRGREQARQASGGVVGEHSGKIYGVAIGGAVVILAFLTLTRTGHVIDAAVQHFMLFYAGVFALIALCASVGLGFAATDRMVLGPGHRVFLQSAHRAASFGAVAFLIVHIVTEILAQRSHVLDAFIPFLSPYRTFYIGLGTIASDLIILLVITSIFRKRFTARGNAWKWRAIHYASYASFVFGVWHGLLGGRPGKPYVDWSYGFVVALVVLGLGVRILSNSLRPKENLSSAPVPETGANSGSAPMRAASMFSQLGIARAAASGGTATGPMMAASGVRGALTTGSRDAGSWGTGPTPALGVLAAPVVADAVVTGPATGPLPGYQRPADEQPIYEPGYEGPPRYRGAPRHPGTGPMSRADTGAMPGTGELPRAGSGPMPRAATGPLPAQPAQGGPVQGGPMTRPATGPMPQAGTQRQSPSGPMPRARTGWMPAAGAGPVPQAGSQRQSPSGPMPRAGTGPLPQAGAAPRSRAGTGPLPAQPVHRGPAHSGPMRSDPMQGGSMTRPATGPMPQAGTRRQPSTGPMPAWPAGSGLPGGQRAASGPFPAAGPAGGWPAASGVPPRSATGPFPSAAWGPASDAAEGLGWRAGESVRNGGYDPAPSTTGGSWDAGADSGLRYREPGPGMPGYQPSRPRGTDPYDVNPYGADLHTTDPYGTGHYDGGQYRRRQYGWDGRP